jgi:chromosomal replication initiation ATPase DnaA
MVTGGQLPLPFAHVPHLTEAEFLEAPSNADALAWLGRHADWPARRLALWGEASVGKTHLLHIWATRAGAALIEGCRLPPLVGQVPPATPLAIDGADAAPPAALLHLLNAAGEAGQKVLLAARAPPAQWFADAALPDLTSRLRAIHAVEIGAPEESLLRALLARLLAERQLAVPEAVQDWMLLRLPRSAAAIHAAAARFDQASLIAGGLAPRAIAAQTLAAMLEDPPSGESSSRDREDSMCHDGGASPGGARLR